MSNAIANQLFLAYTGRPADTAWRSSTTAVIAGATAPSVALQNAFYSAAVLDGVFSLSDSSSQLVNKIFLNLGLNGGVGASTFEQNAWATLINNGTITAQTAAWVIFSSYLGATNVPAAYQQPVQSKLLVIDAYTNELANQPAANLAISSLGSTAASTARTLITSVVSQATAAPIITSISTNVANAGSVVGSTFNLTTGIDTLTGTANADTFNAQVDTLSAVAATSTFNLTDTIAGGAGTDTLNITTTGANGTGGTVAAASVSAVENIYIRAVLTTAADVTTVAAGNFTGATTFGADRATSKVAFTGLTSSQAVSMIGNTTVANGDVDATWGATVTSATLNIASGTTAGTFTEIGTGITSTTVNSTGASNTVASLSLAATNTALTIAATTALTATAFTSAALKTLTVTGAGAVSLGSALATTVTTVDASAATGGLTATLNTGITSVKGSTGNDVITTANGTIATTTASAVDAGAGTGDRLVVAATTDVNTATLAKIYANFEQIQASNGTTVDLSLFTNSTITSERYTGTVTLNNLSAAQATAITAIANNVLTATITNATNVGQIDTIKITADDGSSTVNTLTFGTPSLSGIEIVQLVATDAITIAALTSATALTSLSGSGAAAYNVTTGALALNVNTAFDFSAATGAVTFTAAAATTNAFSYTGSSGVDTVTDSAIAGGTITTGAGNDAVTLTAKTGGTATSTFTLGAGGDTLTVTAGKGNTTIQKINVSYASGDSVSDSTTAVNGFVASKMDTITGVDLANAAAAGAGHVITFTTGVTATAVTFASNATGITFGTTTVTNAGDFYVFDDTGTAGTSYVYQDTNGNKIIDSGEFAVKIVGAAATAGQAGEWTIVSGKLQLSTL